MNKKNLIIVVLLVSVAGLFAEGLNSSANTLKTNQGHIYEVVKARAVAEWDGDHTMIVWEINRQSDAYYEFMDMIEAAETDERKEILIMALIAYTDGGQTGFDNAAKSEGGLFTASIDYVMVVWESNRQINAAGAY